jgi:hypothetical protein
MASALNVGNTVFRVSVTAFAAWSLSAPMAWCRSPRSVGWQTRTQLS